jgi:hypothetical protein
MLTVGDLLVRARRILQEISADGTRWTNIELVDWLNEAYATIVDICPSAYSITSEMTCVAGTRQTIPEEAERLIDVIRNTSTDAGGAIITRTSREAMNASRRRWHGEPQTNSLENYMIDVMDQRHFYVYPPATDTATLEILYSRVPENHLPAEAMVTSTERLRLSDTYAPILLDLVLARAFSKDAETAANAQRAQMHSQSATAALGLKIQSISPSPSPAGAPQQ